jgi:hypothetical protein
MGELLYIASILSPKHRFALLFVECSLNMGINKLLEIVLHLNKFLSGFISTRMASLTLARQV